MELYELLLEYKNLTTYIEEALDKDLIEDTQELLDKRDNIIKKLKSLDYTKEEFKKICKDIDIINIEKRVKDKILKKQISLKKDIDNLKNNQKASNAYGSKSYNGIFLSRKI